MPWAHDLPVAAVGYSFGARPALPDFTLLGSMRRSKRVLVHVAGMRHAHFITYGAALAALPGARPHQEALRGAAGRGGCVPDRVPGLEPEARHGGGRVP